MKHAYLPAYGHARCPHCQCDFNLAHANPTFAEPWLNDILLYVMCEPCHAAYTAGTPARRKRMSKQCFRQFKQHHADDTGRPFPWAVTTALTLQLTGDLVRASEVGHGMPPALYTGIRDGKYDAHVDFPRGLVIVVDRDAEEDSHDQP